MDKVRRQAHGRTRSADFSRNGGTVSQRFSRNRANASTFSLFKESISEARERIQ
jgi:hypothetical protein